jgi:hypothetical protein
MSGRYVDLLTASPPELGDQADALLAATSALEMKQAAHRLRVIALSVRRQIAGPRSEDALLGLGPSVPDPEPGLAELADLAVDVVTAVDYLLNLLDAPATVSRQLVLAGDAGPGPGHRPAYDDARDWLIRKQLDARGAAVRVGTRLVSGLLSDVSDSP